MGVAAQKVNQNLPNLGMKDLKFGMYENLRDYSLGALLQRYKTRVWQIPANKKLSTL